MKQIVFQITVAIILGIVYKYFGVHGLIAAIGSLLGGIIYNQ